MIIPKRFLALGDSFTIGTGTSDELPHLASFDPTVVTLLIGANDIVRGANADRYRRQLRSIYERIHREAPHASMIALPQPDWSLSPAGSGYGDGGVIVRAIERFNAIAREEAERAGGSWIDLFPLMREQAEKKMFAPDGLHPSAEAYAAWARALATTMLASSP